MAESPQTADAKQEAGTTPAALRQLQEMPRDELEHLAEDIGIDPTQQRSIQHLVAAVHERRQMIEAMDREAMMDVIRWGRRPVASNATKYQLALEIARIRSMRFVGLSERALLVLAIMRGVNLKGSEKEDDLIFKLKRQEGFFKRFARKRRAWLGSIVSNMLGVDDQQGDYQYLPPQPGADATKDAALPPPSASSSIREEIEESGLFGGLASRVKRQADTYLNQKLDEIEARIDRKLDEIDRRLAEWRDKEIANRIRILKITLWVSVIVAAVSLIYLYVKTYITPR
jgi:hypothetical protein